MMVHGTTVPRKAWAQIDTPDIFFSNIYYEVAALIEPDFADLTLLEWHDAAGVVRLPLIIREIRNTGYFDATNAYGHGGPWIEGQPDLHGFRKYYDRWAKTHHIVATFLQFHPMFDYATRLAEAFPVTKSGENIVWNLQTDDLVAQMSSSNRRNYRKGLRAGLEMNVTEQPTDLTNFRKLYDTTMRRLGARPFYFFNDAYWHALESKLSPAMVQVDAIFQGETVSSTLNILSKDVIHFQHNGSTLQGRDLNGPVVVHVATAQWAQDHGYTIGHLGGGSVASLLEFKKRFDPATAPRDFSTMQLVHDDENYRRLAQGFPETDYFPVWRDPASYEDKRTLRQAQATR